MKKSKLNSWIDATLPGRRSGSDLSEKAGTIYRNHNSLWEKSTTPKNLTIIGGQRKVD
jgi:hypothetical protein